ncbi:MAG TPA: glucosyl-3-phosphoglycerate synthase [Conexibacter sp.]|jgi:glucosyl-3-phosphoglycerate synthase|nr:glucosyl-3-phosphoglycerate synthase [Conexibacter sp.]
MTPAQDAPLAAWLARRTYAAGAFPLARLLAAKRASVSVVLPAREVAETIGPILAQLVPLRDAGLLDELLVIDAASADGTAAIAERAGATVVQESEILAEHGPARGKGDALWRAVHATRGDVVAFVDADSAGFDARFVLGLLGPLLTDDDVAFVKGAYRRPLTVGAEIVPEGGGRVTELLARPLLNLHVPELAGIVQPLAGELAARRWLLEALPFPVGYGVEIALLIDALRHVGLDALAQVDLGIRRNAHQPLHALSAMAYAVLVAAEHRIHGDAPVDATAPLARPTADGALALTQVAVEERPPLRTLSRSAPDAPSGARQP